MVDCSPEKKNIGQLVLKESDSDRCLRWPGLLRRFDG